jgi:diguanylate cyclase (GGDEF)-like protein
MSARILVVDDNEVNLELLVAMLESEHYVVSTATDGFEALAKIAGEKPDIVLLEVMIPKLDGFEVCRRIKADPATADTPVIMVTTLSSTDDLVRGFEAGADDFVTKPLNGPAFIARMRLQLRRKRDYEQIREVDPLTGAFNRGYFEAHTPRLAARWHATREPVSVLMIDVDNLKQINDAYGHPAGDRVLKQIVGHVTSALRPSGLVARVGGDEFVVVMPETDRAAALQVAEVLRSPIGDTPIEAVVVTVSIGIAVWRQFGEELETTLQRAKATLYKAKEAGGNRVIADAAERHRIPRLRKAVSDNHAIPGHTMSPIGQLRWRLYFVTLFDPNPDTEADAEIASVLNVPLLPYTSDATAARTLIPAGWRWSTGADGSIVCVRLCDGLTAGFGVMRDREANVTPAALAYCLAAVEAHRLIALEGWHGRSARD